MKAATKIGELWESSCIGMVPRVSTIVGFDYCTYKPPHAVQSQGYTPCTATTYSSLAVTSPAIHETLVYQASRPFLIASSTYFAQATRKGLAR